MLQSTSVAEALKRAEEQKLLYERNLVGKSFLYVFIDKHNTITYREVKFERKNFLHLTGLDYKNTQSLKRSGVTGVSTDAEEFYNRLGSDAELINDVSFIQGQNESETKKYLKYTQRKLNNLSQLTSVAAKAEYIGKYNGNQKFDIIINRNMSAIALIPDKNHRYIPVSSLYGKAKDVANDIYPILAIFERKNEFEPFRLNFLNSHIKIGNRLFSDEFMRLSGKLIFSNDKAKFNSQCLGEFLLSYEYSVKKYISEELAPVMQLRSVAFDSEEYMESYMQSFDSFLNTLDDEIKLNAAIEILEEQSCSEEAAQIIGIIKDELKEISKKQSEQTASSSVKIVTFSNDFHNGTFSNFSGTATLSASETFSPPPIEDFFAEIRQAVSKAIQKMKSTVIPNETTPLTFSKSEISDKSSERELVTISAGSTQKDKPQTQPYIPVSQLRKNALAQKKREQQKPHQIKKKKDQQSLD